jgi:hypothetical protein
MRRRAKASLMRAPVAPRTRRSKRSRSVAPHAPLRTLQACREGGHQAFRVLGLQRCRCGCGRSRIGEHRNELPQVDRGLANGRAGLGRHDCGPRCRVLLPGHRHARAHQALQVLVDGHLRNPLRRLTSDPRLRPGGRFLSSRDPGVCPPLRTGPRPGRLGECSALDRAVLHTVADRRRGRPATSTARRRLCTPDVFDGDRRYRPEEHQLVVEPCRAAARRTLRSSQCRRGRSGRPR